MHPPCNGTVDNTSSNFVKSKAIEQVASEDYAICNMNTVLFLLHFRRLKPLLVFYFRVEEKFAGGKFREIPFGVDIIFAGGKFRAKSKFANIAKISSTRKIGVIQ